ncbi:MAG: MATE family efflux transporter [bacterium]|nr:MATE family efflux transporter [bacterium]
MHSSIIASVSAPSRPRPLREMYSLIGLAIPLIASLTTSTALGLVDTYMLGTLGEAVLGAVSLTSSVLLIFYAGLYGLVGPVGILIGQAHGAGEIGKISSIIRHGLVIALAVGLLSVLIMLIGLPLLAQIGQPPEVIARITPYWVAMSFSLIPYVMSLVLKQFYDSTDRPWLGLGLTLVAVVFNIAANWVLIFGNLGFPALGLAGAGIGSLLGQTAGFAAMMLHYRLTPGNAPYRGETVWSLAQFREQLHEGLPMGIQYLLEGGAVTIAGLFVGLLGATQLAANQVVYSVTSVLYMLPLGMASAVTIRVSQAVGGSENDRLPAITRAALVLVTSWAAGFTVLLLFAGEQIAAFFVSETDIIAAAGAIFVAVSFMQVFDGIQSVSLGALRGLLDNRWPTAVSLMGYWLVALPAAYVLGVMMQGGAAGVWGGFSIGLIFASVLLVGRIRFQFRRIANGSASL